MTPDEKPSSGNQRPPRANRFVWRKGDLVPVEPGQKPQRPTQMTQPAKGEPVEIPVPEREDVLGALA
ncbi:MAG TPA: hypothetical protein VKT31_11470, partial [Solirubrobacteraceae bacterium]|nr:hypothetical protein [Solirubrobacteraceae bacterium]